MEEIEGYSTVSGYKINENKYESLSTGTPEYQVFKQCYTFKWDTEMIKYQGIFISKKF